MITLIQIKSNVWALHLYSSRTKAIRNYRRELYKNSTPLLTEDGGAGSKQSSRKTIAQAAKIMSVHPITGNILLALASRKYDTIIELGTAFGISAMYLASGNPKARIFTVEGNPQLAAMAQAALNKYGFFNVTVINCYFNEVIRELVKRTNENTMVFIDGNHSYEATKGFYEDFSHAGMLVFDDIRWSAPMRTAWKEIRKSAVGRHVLDLWKLGVICDRSIKQ